VTDHHVIKLSSLHEMTNLPLGNPNPLSQLLWRFQSLIRFVFLGHLSPCHSGLFEHNLSRPDRVSATHTRERSLRVALGANCSSSAVSWFAFRWPVRRPVRFTLRDLSAVMAQALSASLRRKSSIARRSSFCSLTWMLSADGCIGGNPPRHHLAPDSH
jgi:hypothetical protein